MNNFVLWCTYHRDDIPKEYNLYNSDHFKLFNDDDLTITDDNINYLHDYLCELTTYYYVWKNNLKSDYVGFCQYSKHLRYIDTYKLNKFGFFTYNYHYEKQQKFIDDNSEYHICKNMDYLYRNLIFYIKNKYNVDVFKYYKNHQFIYESWHNNYIFKWDIFCDVCDYIFGYLDYIFTNDKWKIKSNIDFLCKARNDDINEILYRNSYSFPKGLAIFFEWAVGLYIGIRYKLNNNCEYDHTLYNHKDYHNYIITCKDTIKNIDEFKLNYISVIPTILAVSCILWVIITLIPLPFKNTNFISYWIGMIFSIIFCMYIQGNFLNPNFSQLDGGEINWSQYQSEAIVSTIVWLGCICVVIIFMHLKKHKTEKIINI